MQSKIDLHIARKLFHISGGGSVLLGFHYLPRTEGLLLLTGFLCLSLTCDLLRQKIAWLQTCVLFFLRPVMRKEEETGLSGASFMLIGCLLVAYVFQSTEYTPLVTLTLIMLALGDPIAATIGTLYGRRDKLIGQKSLQGTFALFTVGVIASAGCFWFFELMLERLVLASLLSGAAAALAELIPLWKLDDNLSFPVLYASALWVLFSLFGGFSVGT